MLDSMDQRFLPALKATHIKTSKNPSYLLTDSCNVRDGDGGLGCLILLSLSLCRRGCCTADEPSGVSVHVQHSAQMIFLFAQVVAVQGDGLCPVIFIGMSPVIASHVSGGGS